MIASGLLVTLAMMVPPGQMVENHAQPYHYTQPEIHRFERRQDDDDRRQRYDAYVIEVTELWDAYRAAGSTPRAWREYLRALGEARRRYVYADPYLAPITP